jgi:hypothetical protein
MKCKYTLFTLAFLFPVFWLSAQIPSTLYWADNSFSLSSISPTDGTPDVLDFEFVSPSGPAQVTFDEGSNALYIVDLARIIRLDWSNAGAVEILAQASGSSLIRGLAVDGPNSTLYWSEGNSIMQSALDGSNPEVFFESPNTSDLLGNIAIDTVNQQLFVLTFSNGFFSIDIASAAETFVNVPGFHRTIEFDPGQSQVYLFGGAGIIRCDTDGSNLTTLVAGSIAIEGGMALDLVNNQLFWTDTSGSIMRAALDGTNPTTFRGSEFEAKGGMHIRASTGILFWFSRFFGPQTGRLRMVRSPIAYPGGEGWDSVINDGVSGTKAVVVDGQENFIYSTNGASILRSNLDGAPATPLGYASVYSWICCTEEDLNNNGVYGNAGFYLNIKDMDLDAAAQELYWTSDFQNTQYIFKLDLEDLSGYAPVDTIIAAGPDSPLNNSFAFDELALDPANGDLYWTTNSSILTSKINGIGAEVLLDWVSSPLTLPPNSNYGRAIALDAPNQKMYFTDAGNILRANLDGTGLETIVDEASDIIEIELDLTAQLLYWSNADGQLKSATFDGDNISIVSDGTLADGIGDLGIFNTASTNPPLPTVTISGTNCDPAGYNIDGNYVYDYDLSNSAGTSIFVHEDHPILGLYEGALGGLSGGWHVVFLDFSGLFYSSPNETPWPPTDGWVLNGNGPDFCTELPTLTGYVIPSCTATLTAGSATQSTCALEAINEVSYSTTGVIGLTETANMVTGMFGLPDGVSAVWSDDQLTIYGVPTETGTFNYSIPLWGCTNLTVTGTITVSPCGGLQAGCTDTTVPLDADGTVEITPAQVEEGTIAFDGIASLSLDQTSFDCSHIGSDNPVVLTVTDLDGDESTCTANVTILDETPPEAVCQDIIISTDATGNATISPSDLDNGSTDACTSSLGFTVDMATFDCADTEVMVTLTVTDDSDNQSTCMATVTVQDQVAPAAVCQDVAVQLDASGNGSFMPQQADDGSADNCSDNLTFEASQISFDCADLGDVPITLFVNDGSPHSGSGSCMATVTVQDLIPPQAVCTPATVSLDENGQGTLPTFAIDGGSTDNCSTLQIAASNNNFDCADLGAQDITLTVTDGSNNTDNCTTSVTVVDELPPEALCQDLIPLTLDINGQAALEAEDVDDGSFDNCGITLRYLDRTTFSCEDGSSQSVLLTVEDESANSATCWTTVTLNDVTPPTALCQDITVAVDANGQAVLDGSSLDAGSTDNCGIAYFEASPAVLTCDDIGFNTVILTVRDETYNNFANCVSTVTVVDDTPPEAVCVPVNTFALEIDPAAATPTTLHPADIDNGSFDACGIQVLSVSPAMFTCADVGAADVTLTVTDQSGLSSSCTTSISIVNALIGQACDDGDDCTQNDIYDPNCNCAGELIDEDNNGVCDLNECTKPVNLQVSNITANTTELSWTEVGAAEEYLIRYSINGGSANNALSASSSFTLNNLPGSATIDWRVRSICLTGQSAFENGPAFETLADDCPDADGDGICDAEDSCPDFDDTLIGQPCDDGDPCTINDTYSSDCDCLGALLDENFNGECDLEEPECGAPEDLAVFNVGPNQATLSWEAVIGAVEYRLGYAPNGQGGFVLTVPSNTHTLTGLSPETLHLWQVRAKCDGVNSPNTLGPAFTTAADGCPDADQDGICDADDQCPGTDDNIIGTPCNDFDNCTQNDVYTSDCACTGTLIDNNNNGICDLDELCDAPGNLSSTALSPTSGTVSWNPVPGAVAYKLQYLSQSTGVGQQTLSGNSYTFQGFPGGDLIQWRVRTICANSSSSWEVGPALQLPAAFQGTDEAGRGTPKNQVQSPDWHAIEQQLQELSFEVFPNPARHQATLVLSNPVPEAEVVAYSLLGQELMRQSLRGQQVLQLEVSSWAVGHTAIVIAVFEPGQPPTTQKLLLAE